MKQTLLDGLIISPIREPCVPLMGLKFLTSPTFNLTNVVCITKIEYF